MTETNDKDIIIKEKLKFFADKFSVLSQKEIGSDRPINQKSLTFRNAIKRRIINSVNEVTKLSYYLYLLFLRKEKLKLRKS